MALFLAAGFSLAFLLVPGCARRAVRAPGPVEVRFDPADRLLVWPLPIVSTARFTSRFGARKDPLTGMVSFHTGVDLDGQAGNPVFAAARGRVVYQGFRRGYGLLLVLDHGHGLATWYGHCERILARSGERVDRGQVIALIGDTGRATGCHLHFETRKHGQPFDPFTLLPRLRELK